MEGLGGSQRWAEKGKGGRTMTSLVNFPDVDGPGDLTKNSNKSGVLPKLPEGNTCSPHDPLVPRILYPTHMP